ncbi:hypothetical protein BJ742DRAFT_827649 [Cladochytrium replicatum]|nr:hypothetical protein BJ742DRAFT_827649 [Cladochytrium replicatum]
MKLEGHCSYVKSVALSDDGTKVVSQSYDGTVMIWSVFTGQQVDVDSLLYQDDRNGKENLLLQVDSDGWALMFGHMFWFSAEMRGRMYNGDNGVCVVNGSKIYCFLSVF